jgi:hypothetical protein
MMLVEQTIVSCRLLLRLEAGWLLPAAGARQGDRLSFNEHLFGLIKRDLFVKDIVSAVSWPPSKTPAAWADWLGGKDLLYPQLDMLAVPVVYFNRVLHNAIRALLVSQYAGRHYATGVVHEQNEVGAYALTREILEMQDFRGSSLPPAKVRNMVVGI